MENNKSNFGNGFLLGAFVGGLIVFAFGTKKGRQLVKALTENGLEGVSDLGDLIESYKEEGEEEDEGSEVNEVNEPAGAENPPAGEKKPKAAKVKDVARRFFKKK